MDSGNNSTSAPASVSQVGRSPGRVALLMPYWDFWESSVPWDLRADRERLLSEATNIASRVCHVAASTLIPDIDTARDVGEQLTDLDAVVVVSTMAAPSSITTTALDGLRRTPVLVWALSRSNRVDDSFSHTDITTAGSSVGAPMVTSALTRAGYRFDVVASSLSGADVVHGAIRRVVTAGQILRRPLVTIGDPIPGYTTVVPPEGVDQFPRRVGVPASVFAQETAAVGVDEALTVVERIREEFDVGQAVTETALTRAAQAEVALRGIVRATGAVAGAINCHDGSLRGNPSFGFAPCLALGRLTTDGVPFTCTGDVLTALAMFAVRGLGYPTLYHEIEALDFDSQEVILANSGEHDLGLCSDQPLLVPNNWYLHDSIVGPCAQFSLSPGPASLVAFVMAPEPRFVVAEGEFTSRQIPRTGVPNGAFRFHSPTLEGAWSEWIRSGVTHHSVATTGHLATDIRAVSGLLGAQFVQVS